LWLSRGLLLAAVAASLSNRAVLRLLLSVQLGVQAHLAEWHWLVIVVRILSLIQGLIFDFPVSLRVRTYSSRS